MSRQNKPSLKQNTRLGIQTTITSPQDINKLRIYEDTVTVPFRTHVLSMETRLAEKVRSLIEEGHQKLKKELKEENCHISPEPTEVAAISSQHSPARERGYTP